MSSFAIGTAQYEGGRLAGGQMADVLNHFTLDHATFGNHEFDIKQNQSMHQGSKIHLNIQQCTHC